MQVIIDIMSSLAWDTYVMDGSLRERGGVNNIMDVTILGSEFMGMSGCAARIIAREAAAHHGFKMRKANMARLAALVGSFAISFTCLHSGVGGDQEECEGIVREVFMHLTGRNPSREVVDQVMLSERWC